MKQERVYIPSTDNTQVALDTYVTHVSNEIDPDIRRPAILVCPGGGYAFCSEREAEPVALRFAALGFNTFVVWYRVAPNRFPKPQQDAAAAMAYIRKNVAKYALPYDIEFRAELPKTLVGKVAYRVLEEEELKKLSETAQEQ